MGEQPAPEKAAARKRPATIAAENAPWLPTPWDPADALSIQRLAQGQANATEQKKAFEWILRATGINDEPYRPGGEDGRRETDYALGKAHVGREIVKMVKINLARIKGGADGEHG